MASFNKVILMGNLTRDPELRYTPNNNAICKVGLAVNRRYMDQQTNQWVEKPTFVDVTIFGKRGEAFEKYHRKGGMAFLEGRLEFDSWEDKNSGQKRSKLYVVAENWEFVSSGRGEGQGAPGGAGAGGGGGEWGGSGGGSGSGGGRRQVEAPAGGDPYGYDGGSSAGGYDSSSADSGGGDFDDTPF